MLAQLLVSLTIGNQRINSMSEEHLKWLVELMTSMTAPGTADQVDLSIRIDVRADLPKVSVPTLVINMTDDQMVLPHLGKALADGIPGAQVAELDCGHLPIDRGPEWLHLIQHFLATVPAIQTSRQMVYESRQ